MSEYQVNNRRNWKAEVFPYDEFIPDDSKECMYCLTDKQAEILRGIVAPLAWDTRWWSDDDTPIDRDEITAFRDDIIRRLMMSCCSDEHTRFRYLEDGTLQKSEDDGETWEDAPNDDPRNNSTIYPPIEGDDGNDKKCTAAEGMIALIEEQIGNNLTDEMTRYTLQQLITDWVNIFIQTSNIFTALITIATNQIFALSIAIVRPALTEEVYEQLKCIFYCHMGDDASFNNEQWEAVRAQILSDITGVAGLFLEHLVYLLGSVGLTNLARSMGAIEGDCSACDCGDGCSNDWVLRDGFDEFDTILSQDSTQITVQVHTPLSNGVYYIDIHTASYELGCYINSYEVLAGSGVGVAYTAVPSSSEPGFGLGPVNTCCNRLQPQSAGPFTIQFIFDECPP